jgi:hypothetical protein
MSQVYRIRLNATVTDTIKGKDHMIHRVELTKVLSEEEMKDLLRKILDKEGWEKGEDGHYHKTGEGGEELTWNVEEGVVTASLEEEREVSINVDSSGSSGGSLKAAKDNAKSQLEAEKSAARAKIAAHQKDVDAKIAEKLERSESSRVKDLNKVIQKVYTEALKRKATQLGTVSELDENTEGDEYELTIHIAE